MSVSKMQRLTVFAFREDADRIVRRLMDLRCVDVRTADPERGAAVFPYLNAEEELARTEKRLAVIGEALPVLAKYATRKKGLARRVLRVNREAFAGDGRADAAMETAERALRCKETLHAVLAEQSRLQALAESLVPWRGLDLPLNALETAKTVTSLGVFPPSVNVDEKVSALGEAGIIVESVAAEKDGVYCAVTYLRAEEAEANRFLTERGFLKTELPREEKTAEAVAADARSQWNELQTRYRETEETLRDLAEKKDDVEILSDIEQTNRTAAKLKQKLAQTGHCAILDGWVPDSMKRQVGEALEAFECAYELEDPAPGDEPPVLLHNNRFAANFEWVIGMYAYPKYGTFDPTFIMSIFYFIIFGLMFADFGYGLLLAILCFAGIKLLNPRTGMRRMLMMFGFCGISSAIMGAIFGGWFGDLPTAIMAQIAPNAVDSEAGHFFSGGLWFNPLDDPMMFLVVSLAVGAAHIIAGMAIKFVVLCRNGQAGEAVCTILPYWVLFAGFGLLIVNVAAKGTIPSGVAAGVCIAGVVMILLLNGYGQKNPFQRLIKGFGGLYGLISYGSDLLSYSRILALGMVAGVIAKVINMITALGTKGPIGFLVMLVILVVGHGLNIAINILGTFVHAARLQYIEFFGKFYEDGGEPFTPAMPTEEYSENITDGTQLNFDIQKQKGD